MDRKIHRFESEWRGKEESYCGKSSKSMFFTRDDSKVTCPRCLAEMGMEIERKARS